MRVRPVDKAFLFVALVTVGFACAESEPFDIGSLKTGAAGSTGMTTGSAGTTGAAGTGGTTDPSGTAGTTGSAGTTATAGTTGSAGTTGRGGTTGSAGTMGSAGTTGSAGTMGSAGTTGTAGTGGRSGSTGTAGGGGRAGTTGTAGGGGTGGGGMVATFTQVYSTILGASYCMGSGCHNPGKMGNLDYSTKAMAYTTLKNNNKFVAGNAMGSVIWMQVNSGAMPEGKTKLSQANIDMIAAWINAGAMNN